MMYKSRMAIALIALSACAADVENSLSGEFEDEAAEGVVSALSCPTFTASNAAHVQAGRAYTTSRYVLFRRVTTYYARGSNESLGTSATTSTTLYEVAAGTFSRSPTCSAPADAAVPPAPDASVSTPASDASTPTPTDAGAPSPTDAGAASDAQASSPSASSGCGLNPPSSGSGKTVVVKGVTRSYVLTVPSGYDRNKPYPLIFGFHGLGGSGSQAQLYFGLNQATQGQAILVYPDAAGSTKAWGITGTAANDDLAFFDELVRTVKSSLCVDEGRIFAAGHSMGGYFSNALGCARGDTLRAIAPVAGGGPYLSCAAGKVAAWVYAAKDDAVVSASSGEASRDHWVRANGCANTTQPVGPSACVAYDRCDPSHPVHWCLEQTGGHGWPSYAGQAIWSFFRAL